MKWLNFLHFYQPAGQQKDILDAIVAQSYLPVFKIINSCSNSLTANISGGLIEQLDNMGYYELLELIKKAVKDQKVELTGSCKYHAFIPLTPESEIYRQIMANEDTLNFYFKGLYKKHGFFPPEMAYCSYLAPLLSEMGFSYAILDEISYSGGKKLLPSGSLYREKGTDLSLFFRNRRVSNLVMSAVVRTGKSLNSAIKDTFVEPYIVTGMDGETFGHHRPGLENLLEDVLLNKTNYESSSFCNFLKGNIGVFPVEEVEPIEATWASSVADLEKGEQFLSWLDPENIIHKKQWELFNLALALFNEVPESYDSFAKLRNMLDIAVSSDHFWWASAKPWWSTEMIEQGAFRFLDLIQNLPDISDENIKKAQSLYQSIVSTAFEWQRTGKIRNMARQQNEELKIPFKDRTFSKGGRQRGVWNAFIFLMESEEKKAVKNREYEKAIMWRDALFKLNNRLDIYDAINAIDLLRIDIGNGEVEKMLDKYTAKYRKIRGGQPEQRG